jgi:hypothetical protein
MPDSIVDASDVRRAANETVFVLKQMRLPKNRKDEDHLPNAKSFSKIQREAAIMEQLTASPRIVTTYGHCALTILSENVPHEISSGIVPGSGHARQSFLDQLPAARSMNNFTTAEVLQMSLESTWQAVSRLTIVSNLLTKILTHVDCLICEHNSEHVHC